MHREFATALSGLFRFIVEIERLKCDNGDWELKARRPGEYQVVAITRIGAYIASL